jgi:hypothetical protein
MLGPAALSQASPPDPSWTCSAHAGTANVGGASGATFDPLHANIDPSSACRDDGAAVPTMSASDVLGANTVSFSSGSAQAETGLNNAGGPVYAQAPAAVGQTDNSSSSSGGGSSKLTVSARGLRSYAAGHCVGTSAVLASESQVRDLTINGQQVSANGQPDQAVDEVLSGVSPAAPLVHVLLNQEYRTGTAGGSDQTLTREAVRIELLAAPGSSPLSTIVLGSATVGRHGDVCGANPPGSAAIAPPTFPPGANEPGSNGGDVFLGGNGQAGYASASGSQAFSAGGGGAPQINGVNGSECAHMRVFWDLQRHGGRIASHGPSGLRARYGLRHVIRGVVRNCQGKPIVFGRIDVYNVIHGKRHLMKTGLRTRSGGKLTMITPLNYTTRVIEFTYRGLINRPQVASRQRLRIRAIRGGRRA